MRARRLRLGLPATLLAAASLVTGCSEPPPPRPDVLLISLDSVRADMLSFLDARTAPNLVALARRGTIFDAAVSGSSWTLPAHAQMFTGLPPLLHGVHFDHLRIDPQHPTLPERLRAAGYATTGFFTAWYLEGEYGFERGFDTYSNAMTRGAGLAERFQAQVESGDASESYRVMKVRDIASAQDVNSPNVVERAIAALEAAAPDRPQFLFAHFMDPHYDYIPPPPFDRRFDPDYAGDLDGRDFIGNRRILDPEAEPPRQISDRDLEHLRALYRGEIAWTDQALGELVAELEQSGRMERTLIIVTADHGDEFFEHGGVGHRSTLHEELLRVPLLIVPPGPRPPAAPARCDALVSLSDLMPTALDYAGAPVPATPVLATVAGRSLRPLLEGATLPARGQLATLLLAPEYGEDEGAPLAEFRAFESLRTPEWKLVRELALEPGGAPRLEQVTWFDLAADPGEQQPLSDRDDPRLRAAWAALDGELLAAQAAWRALPHSAHEERTTYIAQVFAAELAALGYAGGAADPSADEWLFEPLPGIELAPEADAGR